MLETSASATDLASASKRATRFEMEMREGAAVDLARG
jgi:hypothetical protein